jgi:hypothetical protein
MFSIRKIFNLKKEYEFEPYFYLDNMNNPVSYITAKIKTLNVIKIKETTSEKANVKAFEYINTNYPHLRGKIILKALG